MNKPIKTISVEQKLFLKKLSLISSVLCGVIPSRAYGEGPHNKKYARQLQRINEALYGCDELMANLED